MSYASPNYYQRYRPPQSQQAYAAPPHSQPYGGFGSIIHAVQAEARRRQVAEAGHYSYSPPSNNQPWLSYPNQTNTSSWSYLHDSNNNYFDNSVNYLYPVSVNNYYYPQQPAANPHGLSANLNWQFSRSRSR
jgi:hypothetical protein